MRVVAEVIFTFRKPNGVDAIDQCFERPMEFSPGKWCAQTVMFARAKCHVPAGTRAIQIQSVGIIKAALIAIRCREPNIDQAARRNGHAA